MEEKLQSCNLAFLRYFFHLQAPLPEQEGPSAGTVGTFELMSSKDLAHQMTIYDWELFNCVHEVKRSIYSADQNLLGNVQLVCCVVGMFSTYKSLILIFKNAAVGLPTGFESMRRSFSDLISESCLQNSLQTHAV